MTCQLFTTKKRGPEGGDMNKINVHNALQIGEHMSAEFEDNMSETLQFILKSSQWNQ